MKTARSIMHRQVYSIQPDVSILDAYVMMEDKGIRHLPVISLEGKLVGILSDRDIKKAMIVKKINELDSEITLSKDHRVTDFMSWPVMTINENASIKYMAEIMMDKKISALVIDDGHGGAAGIVTTEDLLAFIVESLQRDDKSYQWPQLTLQYYLSK